MKSAIKEFDLDSEFLTHEQCYMIESWNTADDSLVSIARARLQPGITTKAHYLCDVTERYLIIQGSARAHIGECVYEHLTAGDVLYISPGVSQRITNTGDTDLIFYAICSPRFTSDCYHEI